ncbi:TetR/AcrR family transcriptional regulator [Haladaptatus paucihalophilus]|nr:TetR/AcrR family transcriptional regulator [Haladaptatus paucihalophilus]SHL31940.1 transcriptional regulator, TetR family [Haladaptatus paucihalophilus DX253]
MTADSSDSEWSTSEERIMEATHRALLRDGYAQLSISRIASELDQSKASLYYHYDSKEDLLLSFLEYVTDRLESNIYTSNDESPSQELEQFIEMLLPLQLDDTESQLRAAMVELRSQAVMDEKFRKQFTEIDDRIVDHLERIIDRGIDEGEFRNVDSTRVAEHIFATFSGVMYNRATTNRENAPAAVRVALSSYLNKDLMKR